MHDATDVLAAVRQLLETDVAALDRGQLAATIALSRRVRGWVDAVDVRCARQGRALAGAGRAEPAAALIGRHGGHSSQAAIQLTRRQDAADDMPAFERGLEAGTVSAGHLDALATATRGLDDEARAEFLGSEAELLEHALTDSVDTFTRRCRDLTRRIAARRAASDAEELDRQRAASCVKRWVDRIDGTHRTLLVLDPLRDAALWSAVDRALRRLQQVDGTSRTPWQQLQVNAFVAAVRGGVVDEVGADGEPGSPVDAVSATLRTIDDRIPEVTVVVDYRVLVDGLHEHGICETEDGVPLPVSTVRRLCCDAEIIPVVLGADGEALDVGRASRTATRAQRRALRAMHRTCGEPDCTVSFGQTKAHHIRWWIRDRGPTDISNLLPLCETHHHLVHEGGWTVTMTSDRVATWTRPDGTIHQIGSTIDRGPPP